MKTANITYENGDFYEVDNVIGANICGKMVTILCEKTDTNNCPALTIDMNCVYDYTGEKDVVYRCPVEKITLRENGCYFAEIVKFSKLEAWSVYI